MSAEPAKNRREFLTGQAAAEAWQHLLDGSSAASLGSAAGGTGGTSMRPQTPPPEPESGYLVHVSRRAMACSFEISLHAGQYPQGTVAALAALDRIEALEEQLTVYRPQSEMSQLNQRACHEPVQVELELFRLLQECRDLWEKTGGAFDITSGPLSKVWGFFQRQGRMPEEAELAACMTCVGSQHLELDATRQTVRFRQPGMELNLGSIGKGYALDRAAEVLAAEGIDTFLLHGGKSSVLARGSATHDPTAGWWIGLHDPLRPGKPLAQVWLQNQALGTSGDGNQFFRFQGQRYGHLLDPRTGWPASRILSSTVVGPRAAEADALATAFSVLEPEATAAFCVGRPDLAVLLVVGSPGQPATQIEVRHWGFEPENLRLAASS